MRQSLLFSRSASVTDDRFCYHMPEEEYKHKTQFQTDTKYRELFITNTIFAMLKLLIFFQTKILAILILCVLEYFCCGFLKLNVVLPNCLYT